MISKEFYLLSPFADLCFLCLSHIPPVTRKTYDRLLSMTSQAWRACSMSLVFHSTATTHDDIVVDIRQGNKKGPVKRWDFDTEDDYSEYQSRREAMPK